MIPDEYTVRARIAPVLVVITPVAVFVATSAVVHVKLAVFSGILGAALLILVAQLGRQAGKRLEPGLWQEWGGTPTTQLLRWRGAGDPAALARRHALIAATLGHHLPTSAEEAADPAGADQACARAVATLKERTRDKSAFPLVFAENADYGFRRNLLGLRRFGIVLAALSLAAASAVVLAAGSRWRGRLGSEAPTAAVSIAWLVLFCAVTRPSWVRAAAFDYAERLMAALEVL